MQICLKKIFHLIFVYPIQRASSGFAFSLMQIDAKPVKYNQFTQHYLPAHASSEILITV